jgi:signal transduction histidine kinase
LRRKVRNVSFDVVHGRAQDELGLPWKRALLWAFALVVGCFLTETVVSQLVASAIDDAAMRIITDYSPSVVALASTRAELHRMQDFVSDYVAGGGDTSDRDRIASSMVDLDSSVESYLKLPTIPGERELWRRTASDIVNVRETADRTIVAVERGDADEAKRLVRNELRAAVDRASADILGNIELNASAADMDGHLIAHRRRTSMQAAIALALASVALTALAALLVYRISMQHEAIQRRHAEILSATNAELEVFASRVSHDILSPLSSTRLAIESALKADLSEGVRRKLQRGAGGLDRVTRIARALFDFARAGARPDPGERGDVRTVVDEVVDEYLPIADQAGARLEASVPAHGPVACNEGLLTAALSNLVRNALTHLDAGPGKRVDILAADAGDRVRIEVRDTGPGLAPGTEARVFDPYVRGPGTAQPGLGLGLATVKRIVETHGGTVGVESRVGVGCRFWMELPRAAATVS